MPYLHKKYSVLTIKSYSNGVNAVEMSEEFDEISDIIAKNLNLWNEVQERHDAVMEADNTSIARLCAHIKTLLTVLEHSYTEEKIKEIDVKWKT